MAETIEWILRNRSGAIWTTAPDATVYDALALMAEKEIGALMVMQGPRLLGVVSERDYARKVILQGRVSKETLVREIMTSPAVTVTRRHTVEECMRLVTHHRVRHLPVMEGDRLVGVVSIGDLVNAIISDQAHTIHQLHTYIGARYPA